MKAYYILIKVGSGRAKMGHDSCFVTYVAICDKMILLLLLLLTFTLEGEESFCHILQHIHSRLFCKKILKKTNRIRGKNLCDDVKQARLEFRQLLVVHTCIWLCYEELNNIAHITPINARFGCMYWLLASLKISQGIFRYIKDVFVFINLSEHIMLKSSFNRMTYFSKIISTLQVIF